MPAVKLKENESYPDGLVRRFKRAVEKSGLLADLKRKQFYIKPSKLRQQAKAAAQKRWRKKVYRDGSSSFFRDRDDR
jgi:small subunit ribosomal protein S21